MVTVKYDEVKYMIYNITDFGAIADGKTNNALAIQNAIDKCSDNSGGVVYIPSGEFLSGTLLLKSNVNLYLEQGAILKSSIDQNDIINYTKDFETNTNDSGWEGGCFLCAFHSENITISGDGTIYGQGDKVFSDTDADNGYNECPKDIKGLRPRTTFFEDIKNLTVKDVTFKDAAFWTLHMAGCKNVIVDRVKILNDPRGANNDGIDPDSCKDVVISNCIIESGDDAIVVKNTIEMGKKYGACENVLINNCILHSQDSALKIGTETHTGIKNVVLANCIVKECSRGIGIWVRYGATVENIRVHDIIGSTRRYADRFSVEGHQGWWGKGEPIFISNTPRYENSTGKTGIIRNVTFENVEMDCEAGIFMRCDAGCPIENIKLKDISLTMKKIGRLDSGMFDEQPSVRGKYEHEVPAIYANGINGLLIKDFEVTKKEPYLKGWSDKEKIIKNCINVKEV